VIELDRNSGAGPDVKKDAAAKVMMINCSADSQWWFKVTLPVHEVSLAAHI
jgi:hypothetical protein